MVTRQIHREAVSNPRPTTQHPQTNSATKSPEHNSSPSPYSPQKSPLPAHSTLREPVEYTGTQV